MQYLINAAIKGIIEGFTEFLPISSTGHLVLVREMFPLAAPARAVALNNLFDIVVQFPAVLAIFILYRRRLWDSVSSLPQRQESQRFWFGIDRSRRSWSAVRPARGAAGPCPRA